jgi:hypothetical protein
MSEIRGNSGGMMQMLGELYAARKKKESAVAEASQTSGAADGKDGDISFVLDIDYGNQYLNLTLPGNWSGSLNPPPPPTSIQFWVEYDDDDDVSTIYICFKTALPGDQATATLNLTTGGVTFPFTFNLSVPT